MPLILAIERDRHQAARLAAIVRTWSDVELCQARAAADGIRALDGRIPDLVLTSPLLSSRDEGLLAEHMRALGSAGSHVQTVRIPILGGSISDGGSGLLGLLRRGRAQEPAQEGCDPDVFSKEIAEYLERACGERVAAASGDRSRVAVAVEAPAIAAQDAHLDTPIVGAPDSSHVASASSMSYLAPASPINGHASMEAPADYGTFAAAGESTEVEGTQRPDDEVLAEEYASEEVEIDLSARDTSAAAAAVAERFLRLSEERGDPAEPAADTQSAVVPPAAVVNGLRSDTSSILVPDASPIVAPVHDTWAAAPAADWNDAGTAVDTYGLLAVEEPPLVADQWASAPPVHDPFGSADAPFIFDASAFLVTDEAIEPQVAAGAQAPVRNGSESRVDPRPPAAAPAATGHAERAATARTVEPQKPAAAPPPAEDAAPRAAQDEWGFFDPERCGFAALTEALEDAARQHGSRTPGAQTPVNAAASSRPRSVVAREHREPTHA